MEDEELKCGMRLIDDVGYIYKVLSLLGNCAVVEPFPNPQCMACEIMSFKAMDKEGWEILSQ